MNKRHKIAIVTNSTWNIFNYRSGLIKFLFDNGYEIIAIAPFDQYAKSLNAEYLSKLIGINHFVHHSRNPWKELKLIRELYGIYKREKPDLILHYTIKPNIFGSIVARVLNIPNVVTLTGLGSSFINKNYFNPIIEKLYHFALKKAEKVAFHNEDDKAFFVSKGIVDKTKTLVIPGSGVDSNYFKPQPKSRTKKLVFLFLARLLRDKGIVEFVDAATKVLHEHRDVEFHVAGELFEDNPNSISKTQLSESIEKNKIVYLGKVQEVKDLLQSTDVLVLPSYREGLPKAILEAMAMAKPIIATDVPGCRSTVDEGINGYLVPVKDSNALAIAMVKMSKLSDLERQKMGNASRQKVLNEFDEKIINKVYLNLIHKTLQSLSSA